MSLNPDYDGVADDNIADCYYTDGEERGELLSDS